MISPNEEENIHREKFKMNIEKLSREEADLIIDSLGIRLLNKINGGKLREKFSLTKLSKKVNALVGE